MQLKGIKIGVMKNELGHAWLFKWTFQCVDIKMTATILNCYNLRKKSLPDSLAEFNNQWFGATTIPVRSKNDKNQLGKKMFRKQLSSKGKGKVKEFYWLWQGIVSLKVFNQRYSWLWVPENCRFDKTNSFSNTGFHIILPNHDQTNLPSLLTTTRVSCLISMYWNWENLRWNFHCLSNKTTCKSLPSYRSITKNCWLCCEAAQEPFCGVWKCLKGLIEYQRDCFQMSYLLLKRNVISQWMNKDVS